MRKERKKAEKRKKMTKERKEERKKDPAWSTPKHPQAPVLCAVELSTIHSTRWGPAVTDVLSARHSDILFVQLSGKRLPVLPGGHCWGHVQTEAVVMAHNGACGGCVPTPRAPTARHSKSEDVGFRKLPLQMSLDALAFFKNISFSI